MSAFDFSAHASDGTGNRIPYLGVFGLFTLVSLSCAEMYLNAKKPIEPGTLLRTEALRHCGSVTRGVVARGGPVAGPDAFLRGALRARGAATAGRDKKGGVIGGGGIGAKPYQLPSSRMENVVSYLSGIGQFIHSSLRNGFLRAGFLSRRGGGVDGISGGAPWKCWFQTYDGTRERGGASEMQCWSLGFAEPPRWGIAIADAVFGCDVLATYLPRNMFCRRCYGGGCGYSLISVSLSSHIDAHDTTVDSVWWW